MSEDKAIALVMDFDNVRHREVLQKMVFLEEYSQISSHEG